MEKIARKKRYFFITKVFDSVQSLSVSSLRWDQLQRRCYPYVNLESLCLSWRRKYYLYNRRAHNWRYPRLGQRLWHIFVFSTLLKWKNLLCFLRLGYMHSTRILFLDRTFTCLTFSRCVFPDDVFISVFMVKVSLSVPQTLSNTHSVTTVNADESFKAKRNFQHWIFYKKSCCTWRRQLLFPGEDCRFNPGSLRALIS